MKQIVLADFPSIVGRTTYDVVFYDVSNKQTVLKTSKCIVTFKDYDGRIISQKQYGYNAKIEIPEFTGTRVGYTFIGWGNVVIDRAKDNYTYTAQYEETPMVRLVDIQSHYTDTAMIPLKATKTSTVTGALSFATDLSTDIATIIDNTIIFLKHYEGVVSVTARAMDIHGVMQSDGRTFTVTCDGTDSVECVVTEISSPEVEANETSAIITYKCNVTTTSHSGTTTHATTDNEAKVTFTANTSEEPREITGIIFCDHGQAIEYVVKQAGAQIDKYIVFKDPQVETILMNNNVSSDGIGITYEDAAKVKSFGSWFVDSNITSFNEMQYFTGITELTGNSANTYQGQFRNCTELTEVTFPTSLKYIRGAVFWNCPKLTKVNGLSNVYSIACNNFNYKENLDIDGILDVNIFTNFNIFNNTTFSNDKLVLKTNNLTKLTSGHEWGTFAGSNIYGLILLGSYNDAGAYNVYPQDPRGMCYECRNLHFAILGDRVKTMGARCFKNCSSMAFTILLSASVPSVNVESFNGTLTTSPIYVRDNLLAEYKATDGWKSTSYNITNRLRPISQFATDFPEETMVIEELNNYFENQEYIQFADSKVEELLISKGFSMSSEGITVVEAEETKTFAKDGDNIFKDNTEITSFNEISQFGVTSVGLKSNESNQTGKTMGYSFDGCTNLESIDLTNMTEMNNFAFKDCSSLAIDLNMPNLTSWYIPTNSYDCKTFSNSGIISISNLGTCNEICGFSNCRSLKWAKIDNVKILRTNCFNNCSELEVVRLYDVEEIHAQCFNQCTNLKTLILGDKLTSIGRAQFYNGTSNLESLVVKATTPPAFDDDSTFALSSSAKLTIYVPDDSLDEYKAADGWKNYLNKIKPLSEFSEYIVFADREVERILIDNGYSTDKIGVTKADAMAVTSFGTIFQNAKIESFMETVEFENWNDSLTNSFGGSSIKYINAHPYKNVGNAFLLKNCRDLRIMIATNYTSYPYGNYPFQYNYQLECVQFGENIPANVSLLGTYSRSPLVAIPRGMYDEYVETTTFKRYVDGENTQSQGSLIPDEWVKYLYPNNKYPYRQLEYLDLDGRGFFTDKKLGTNFKIELDVKFEKEYNTVTTIFGSRDSSKYLTLRINGTPTSGYRIQFSYNGYEATATVNNINSADVHKIIMTKSNINFDGEDYPSSKTYNGGESYGYGIGIGRTSYWGQNKQYLEHVKNYYKFYGMKQWDGDNLVLDLIPAVINEDAEGLYDLVNKKFYAPYGAFESNHVTPTPPHIDGVRVVYTDGTESYFNIEGQIFCSEGSGGVEPTQQITDVKNAKEIYLWDRITQIGHDSFNRCNNLIDFNFSNNITSIDDDAFYGCTNLKNISLPSELISVGNSAFNGCSSLILSSLSSGITSIGEWAFNGCSNITLSELPSGITSINNGAFYGCSSIILTSLPSGVTSIGDSAFNGCSSIVSIELPSNITNIGDSAFMNCSKLASVIYNGTTYTKKQQLKNALKKVTCASNAFDNTLLK